MMAILSAPLIQPDADYSTLSRMLAETPVEILIDRIWLSGSDRLEWRSLRDQLRATRRPVFPLKGRDLLNLGVIPGRRVGVLLRIVRDWWLTGNCVANREICLEKAKQLIAENYGG